MTMIPGPLSGSRGICFGSHVAPGKYGRGGFCVSPELWIHVAAEKHRGAGEQPTWGNEHLRTGYIRIGENQTADLRLHTCFEITFLLRLPHRAFISGFLSSLRTACPHSTGGTSTGHRHGARKDLEITGTPDGSWSHTQKVCKASVFSSDTASGSPIASGHGAYTLVYFIYSQDLF